MKLITPPISLGHNDLRNERGVENFRAQVPNVEVRVDEMYPHHSCGWPIIRLVGELPDLLEALSQWFTGDSEEDLLELNVVLSATKPV